MHRNRIQYGLVFIGLIVGLLVHPFVASSESEQAVAIAAAEDWVGLIDQGKYSESWKQASTLVQNAVPEKDWGGSDPGGADSIWESPLAQNGPCPICGVSSRGSGWQVLRDPVCYSLREKGQRGRNDYADVGRGHLEGVWLLYSVKEKRRKDPSPFGVSSNPPQLDLLGRPG